MWGHVLNCTHVLALVKTCGDHGGDATKFVQVSRCLSLCFLGECFTLSFLSY